MAFLTLFRVATGDNWNGIMKDTLREDCDWSDDCVRNCCVSRVIAPVFFVVFVLMAQFVLVNVVVAVLMRHLEVSGLVYLVYKFANLQHRDVMSVNAMDSKCDLNSDKVLGQFSCYYLYSTDSLCITCYYLDIF